MKQENTNKDVVIADKVAEIADKIAEIDNKNMEIAELKVNGKT